MRRILSFRDFDWPLLLLILAMCGVSLLEVYSTTVHTRFSSFESKQLMFIGAGLVGMFVLSRIDYHQLLDLSPWFYRADIPVFGPDYFIDERWVPLCLGGIKGCGIGCEIEVVGEGDSHRQQRGGQ